MMARKVFIIGHPLSHSLSPLFQKRAFDFYHLDVTYTKCDVTEEDLEKVVTSLREPQYLGANVTIPYKEKVVRFLDRVSPLAKKMGVVNTLVNREGILWGYNTDVEGFMRALEEVQFNPQGKRAAILGAGGAARAVCFGLLAKRINSISILNRTKKRAEELCFLLKKHSPQTNFEVLSTEDSLPSFNLLVNCTPLGMEHSGFEERLPIRPKFISPSSLVFDLVYNPRETPLLREAQKVGAKTLNGLSMLIYQGAASFKLWTGREAPVEAMWEAISQSQRYAC
jgi:shikimate dehydrogenase